MTDKNYLELFLFENIFNFNNIKKNTDSKMKEVYVYIQTNYKEKITESFLSEKFNLTKNYLTKRFVNCYNKTPKQFQKELLFENAKELILSDYLKKIKEIAFEIGYNDEHSFSRDFKKYSGYSPLEYRKEFF